MCHPDGVEIKEIRVTMEILVRFLAEELESLGYTNDIHDHMTHIVKTYGAMPARQAAPSAASTSESHEAQPSAASSS